MAAAVFEAAEDPEFADVPIRVVPGVSAVQAVAARAGAPIGADFAVMTGLSWVVQLGCAVLYVAAMRGAFVLPGLIDRRNGAGGDKPLTASLTGGGGDIGLAFSSSLSQARGAARQLAW